jgi:hypothetical protein
MTALVSAFVLGVLSGIALRALVRTARRLYRRAFFRPRLLRPFDPGTDGP